MKLPRWWQKIKANTLLYREKGEVPVGEVKKKIVIIGNPNVGKSVLFNNLTNSYVTVSNYPGTSVEVTTGFSEINGVKYE
ncbi:MAG: 50S ribosome-binding GTPase, partial [Desulfobacterota bacterium]|nr:50S ribosome-binding GTPase [Thermodesulfobacteriota bacterium]